MTITKELEAAILKDYYLFWEANLNAEMEAFSGHLTDDFSIIGTANGEVFFGRENAMAFYAATAHELAGKAQLRNREVSIQALADSLVVLRELSDLYVLIGVDWTFYGHARISCIVKNINGQWKAVHQHASFPDHRTEEGQQLASEKIEKENLNLKEAVQRRTVELEAKSRELEIEAAVERVRTQSMGMQVAGDLAKVNEELFAQISKLNIDGFTGVAIYLVDETGMVMVWDLSSPGSMGNADNHAFKYDPEKSPIMGEFVPIWREGKLDYFIMDYPKERLLKTVEELAPAYPAMAENFREAIASGALQHQWNATAIIANGILSLDMMKPPTEEVKAITLKMAGAFNQAYQRFNDLQKAEKQTRLAQIELAVERVRAKALAMHNSVQIGDVVETLRHEMLALEIPGVVAATIYLQEEDGDIRMWDLSSVKQLDDGFHVSLDVKFKLEETDPGLYIRRVWNNANNYFVEKQEPHDMVITLNWLRQYYPEQANEVQEYLAGSGWQYLLHPTIQLAHGKMSVDIFNMAPPDEMESIMIKMGAAFDLAYKRFIDLQKSEQQNREAQIELALERVRVVAMTMSKPVDLLNISKVLFKELQVLNFADLRNSIIHTYGDIHEHFLDYDYSDFTGGSISRIPYTGNAIIEKFIADIQQSKDAFSEIAIEGERLQLWRSFRDHNNELPDERLNSATALYYYFYSIGEAAIGISTFTPITAQKQETLRRFRNVFDLAYQRYVDITKAAAQTREAQIELSLERIRAKVTAMKVSKDLLDIVVTMRTEFVGLGHEAHYFWHMRWQPDIYEKAMTSGDGTRIGNVMTLPRHMHGDIPLIAEWEKGTAPHVVFTMDADAAVDYVVKMIELGDFEQVDPNAPTLDDIRHISGLTFIMARTTHGEIGFSLPGPVLIPSPDAIATLVRFAAVFDLAYRRFEDLKSSEKQIREAQIELALERVRARTMAMQHSDELADASFVLDTQVRALGIETRGCAFNIYGDNESTEWFSSKMGTMPSYKTPREALFLRYFEAGKTGEEIHVEKFEGEKCTLHYNYLMSLPGIGDGLKAMVAAGGTLPTHQVDHAVFFKYGYLLFITAEEVPEAHEVFIRFGKVFEQTYTRFLDLQKAEAQTLRAEQDLLEIKAARKKAEETLVELQATQKQLIQSEKMASLGELTAGIAHEIQNPLNFVNNFSDLNKELISELVEQVELGNAEEVKEIAKDIKSNEEKINHHGKRADAIVRGMLQHSQSSTGKKVATDINKLADEYLKLSYHGLRAKDKSFNATINTEYDESIGDINIIPQDIGRVLLNLFNNAFYAVKETTNHRRQTTDIKKEPTVSDKLKNCQGASPDNFGKPVEAGLNYEPTITIITERLGDKIEITVSDNGNGIPSSIIDKIFQPFFTTKPTGQGTGLGLSLAYDIIKAHGGELKVETKEGEGSTFIIQLPVINA